MGAGERERIKRAGTLQLIQLKAVSPLPGQFNQMPLITLWNQSDLLIN